MVTRPEHLAEDWHGTYWYFGVLRAVDAHEENGYRFLSTYSAMCTDQECCWYVVVRRGPGGWRWEHDAPAGLRVGEPREHWQQAAADAIEAGEARPRR